jgi:hypothetical protein
MNIKLPENMAVGLILPLSLIALDNSVEDWLGNWPPLAHLLEEVDWSEFFRQTGIRLTEVKETPYGKQFLHDLRQNKVDLSDVLANLPLSQMGFCGIIIRLDVAGFESDEDFPYFKWKHFYGYCEDFKDVERAIQWLIEKASQDVAAS